MNHADHVELLRSGVSGSGVWADLGSGGGAFTLALADLLDSDSRIYSVDRDDQALKRQDRVMSERFPTVSVDYIVADFGEALDLPLLDGVVMANSLHFVRDQVGVLRWVKSYLRSGGSFILVEYNATRGNQWVPYPISYLKWEKLSVAAGFVGTRMIGRRSSRFLNEIYSAVSFVSR